MLGFTVTRALPDQMTCLSFYSLQATTQHNNTMFHPQTYFFHSIFPGNLTYRTAASCGSFWDVHVGDSKRTFMNNIPCGIYRKSSSSSKSWENACNSLCTAYFIIYFSFSTCVVLLPTLIHSPFTSFIHISTPHVY